MTGELPNAARSSKGYRVRSRIGAVHGVVQAPEAAASEISFAVSWHVEVLRLDRRARRIADAVAIYRTAK